MPLKLASPEYVINPRIEVGCDEVGRGSLAGPVVAAAVIFPPNIAELDPDDTTWSSIRDSKKLSKAQRERLADYIRETAIDFGIGSASCEEIDAVNILRATHLAMHRALDALSVDFDHILVDGSTFKCYMPRAGGFATHTCVVKGDDEYVSIAAASILAKVHRDELMVSLAAEHPAYEWDRNMGYGTEKHMAALREGGPCVHHRRTFLKCLREPDETSEWP